MIQPKQVDFQIASQSAQTVQQALLPTQQPQEFLMLQPTGIATSQKLLYIHQTPFMPHRVAINCLIFVKN